MSIQRNAQIWKKITRHPSTIALSILLLAVALLGFLRLPFAAAKGASAPPTSYHINGLAAPVTIIYDATGMPHILASNEQTGYAGVCFAVARDRLFQLDELRRAAEGRLAEIFGAGPNNNILQQDELFRTFDLVQLAQLKYAAANATVQRDLAACALGINAEIGVAEAHHTLPPEFSDLGYTPDYWQPWQSELIALYFSISLDSNVYLAKLERANILGLAGPQVAAALMPDPPDTPSMFDAQGTLNSPTQFLAVSPTTTTLPVAASKGDALTALATTAQRLAPITQVGTWATALLGGDRASNNFAIDGTLTASGKPLLANDPHLQLATPSLLYLVQLTVTGSASYSFEGLMLPGFPAFLSGHNQAIAYGVTTTNIDDSDLIVETIRQAPAGEQVLYKGQWIPVQSRLETFHIAGAASVTLTIQVTPHGPVLNAAMPGLNVLGTLAFEDTEAQTAWTVDGFFVLPQASSWQTFRAALAQESVGLNFLFADSVGAHGHIGYQLTGLIPQRTMENTLVPVSGGDGAHEWTGYAAFSQLPSVYNPPGHLLETSNNRIVPSTYAPGGTPIYISRYFDLAWRSERAISLLLRAGSHLTAADLANIQLDTQTTVGPSIAADLGAALGRVGLPAHDPYAASALAALRTWDGNASAASLGATIYETLVAVLDRDVVSQALGPGAYQAYTQGVFITTQIQALQTLLETPQAPFFGAASNAEAPARRDLAIQRALAETDTLLGATLGSSPSGWLWGKLHTLTYNHPLAPVDPRFTIGTFPMGGDGETVDTGGWFMELGLLELPANQFAQAGGAQAAFMQDALATARVVWDMSDFDQSLGVLDTGESGDPTSQHWADQAVLWQAGKYNVLPFTASALNQQDHLEIILT